MTKLLEQAFAKAAKLPEAEQEVLASRLLSELEEETAFDKAITLSKNKLKAKADAALEEFEAGQTQLLDPEKL